MTYEAKDYSTLLGTAGFSDNLLNTHFKLYTGYVKRTNAVVDRLATLAAAGTTGAGEYAELKRRFGWEFNGMRLHELYFGNLTNLQISLAKDTPFYSQIVKDFGSYENWEAEFKATGGIPGLGWVVLYYDAQANAGQGQLFNVWINEHDLGHPSGAIPLLVMDVFEHAFITDYGLAKADYITAFMAAINWDDVNARFQS